MPVSYLLADFRVWVGLLGRNVQPIQLLVGSILLLGQLSVEHLEPPPLVLEYLTLHEQASHNVWRQQRLEWAVFISDSAKIRIRFSPAVELRFLNDLLRADCIELL